MDEIIKLAFSEYAAGLLFAALSALIGKVLLAVDKKTGLQTSALWRDKLHLALKTHTLALFERMRVSLGSDPTPDQVFAELKRQLKHQLAHTNPDTAAHFNELKGVDLAELALQYIPKKE